MKKWDRIRSDYEKAEAALDATASRGLRRPKEDIGRYYLWKAYHSASTADEVKDHLLYARILTRMAYENDHRVQGDMFTKYLIPALKEYDKAVAAGQQPDGEECERVQHSVDCFLHDQQSKAAPQEEHLRMIDGHEKLGDFNFFFSKTVSFEHKGTTIRMALRTEQKLLESDRGGGKRLQRIRRQDPVLSEQRHDIHHRRKPRQHHQRRPELSAAVKPRLRRTRGQRVREKESDTRPADLLCAQRLRRFTLRGDLGIDQRLADGERLRGQMVVRHHDRHAAIPQHLHFRRRRDAAIDRHDQRHLRMLRKHPLDAGDRHAIALREPVRQKRLGHPAETTHRRHQNGARADAVAIIVPEDDDRSPLADKRQDHLDGGGNARKRHRPGNAFQRRIEELFARRSGQAPLGHQLLNDAAHVFR